MFKKIRELLGKDKKPVENRMDLLKWLDPAETPWDIPVLDLRQDIGSRMSFATDPDHAKNAISFGRDTGTSFIGEDPMFIREIPTSIFYPTDGTLLDGIFYSPREMEDKWAIFYHNHQIIIVRSWLRKVFLVANVRDVEGGIEVYSMNGTFTQEGETNEETQLYFDILMRNAGTGVVHPITYPDHLNEVEASDWCFSFFGKLAVVATPQIVEVPFPKPLRTNSLFHFAIVQQQLEIVDSYLNQGIHSPLAKDGQTPLQWAGQMSDTNMMAYLIDKGVPVDAPSVAGTTALILSVERNELDIIQFLVSKGADVNAQDTSGFTALHRSADMGMYEITKYLLEQGAEQLEIEGHTPLSLAEMKGRTEIIQLLQSYG